MKTEITFVCDNCGKRREDKGQAIGMIIPGCPMDWYAITHHDGGWAVCSVECLNLFTPPTR